MADPKSNANESSGLEYLVQGHCQGQRQGLWLKAKAIARPDKHKAKATNFGLEVKAKN